MSRSHSLGGAEWSLGEVLYLSLQNHIKVLTASIWRSHICTETHVGGPYEALHNGRDHSQTAGVLLCVFFVYFLTAGDGISAMLSWALLYMERRFPKARAVCWYCPRRWEGGMHSSCPQITFGSLHWLDWAKSYRSFSSEQRLSFAQVTLQQWDHIVQTSCCIRW